jgi:hypothetical protein
MSQTSIQLGAYKPQISPLIKRISNLVGYRGSNITIQVTNKVIIDEAAWDKGSFSRFYLFRTWDQGFVNSGVRIWEVKELPLSIGGTTDIVAKTEVVHGQMRSLTLFIRPEAAPTIFPKK